VDFWATWAAPARAAIPHLNELQTKFRDKLVVIGLSNESVEEMSKMTAPKVVYYVGTDTQARTMNAFQLGALPHSVLIDPTGIVRYEGHSKFLDAAALERLMTKYAP
jgi:thiol-disulfide isomerase/thioredoxin